MKPSMQKNLRRAILLGFRYLVQEQEPSGEFRTYQSEQLNMGQAQYRESPFFTGLVLLTLKRSLHTKESSLIIQRGLKYLVQTRHPGGLYYFLQKDIAADLDDICLNHYILQQHFPHQYSYKKLAQRCSQMVTSSGAFPTWVDEDIREGDIDPIVNVNVIRYLHRNQVDCSKTLSWIRQVLEAWTYQEGTRYYVSPFSLLYFFATLPRNLRDQILGPNHSDFLQDQLRPHIGQTLGILDEAYLLFSLITLLPGHPASHPYVEKLLGSQLPNGAWPPHAAFQAFNYWGADTFNTALVLQALLAYQRSESFSIFGS